jgi:hypothetical protein
MAAARNYGVVIEYNPNETSVFWYHTMRDAKTLYKEASLKYRDVSLVKFIQ